MLIAVRVARLRESAQVASCGGARVVCRQSLRAVSRLERLEEELQFLLQSRIEAAAPEQIEQTPDHRDAGSLSPLAGLALRAAASGLPITRLVVHEPPYGGDDEESTRAARDLAERVRTAIAEERRSDAIGLFLTAAGLPPEIVDETSRDPRMFAVAPTMPYDFEIMGDFSRGGTIPEELVRAIRVPTLVIAGGASLESFRDVAARIAAILPNGTHVVLEGQDHGASADVVAPVVARFLTTGVTDVTDVIDKTGLTDATDATEIGRGGR